MRPFPFSRLVCRRSLDGGQSWLRRQIIDECVVSPKLFAEARSWLSEEAVAGYEETRARISDAQRVGASMNCPRLLRLHDGQLLLVVDYRIGAPPRRASLGKPVLPQLRLGRDVART